MEASKFFIKDISFEHEKEIRGELSVGVSYTEQFSSWEEWARDPETRNIPIKDNKNNELNTIEFINVGSSFVEEVSFDPRMPSYKKELLIKKNKIPLLY